MSKPKRPVMTRDWRHNDLGCLLPILLLALLLAGGVWAGVRM